MISLLEHMQNTVPTRNRRVTARDGTVIPTDILPAINAALVAIAAVAAWFADTVLNGQSVTPPHFDAARSMVLLAVVIAPFLLYDRQLGQLVARTGGGAPTLRFLLRYVLLLGALTVLGARAGTLEVLPRSWLLLWAAAALLLTAGARFVTLGFIRRLHGRGELAEVVAVVGSGAAAARLVSALLERRDGSVDIVGVFDDHADVSARHSDVGGGTIDQLLALGRRRRIDWILIALPGDAERIPPGLVERLKVIHAAIALSPRSVGSRLSYQTVGYVADRLPVALVADRPMKRWHGLAKDAEDLVGGTLITMLLLPVLALIALAVRIDSPGPILFKQRRHGVNNEEFDVFKFRTMRWVPTTDGGDLVQTIRGDVRITRVGRWLRRLSLDELPQLFNVLRGEMSLVGPRPHAVEMRTENRLGAEITRTYPHRHRVRPGITGWSQVNGARGATTTQAELLRRVDLDLYYIDHWSLGFDLRILLRTFGAVVRTTNAY